VGLPAAKRDDPALAVPAGARYMRELWDQWKAEKDGPPRWDRTRFALASYNAGLGRVLQAQREAGNTDRYECLEKFLPEHTRDYVARVMEFFIEYRESGRYRKPASSGPRLKTGVRFWKNPVVTDR